MTLSKAATAFPPRVGEWERNGRHPRAQRAEGQDGRRLVPLTTARFAAACAARHHPRPGELTGLLVGAFP